MKRKIVGVTVGTSLNPEKIKEKLNPVTSVNDVTPDENGNVEIPIPEQDSPILFVDINEVESRKWVSNRSFDEIKEHLENGGFVVGRYNGKELFVYEVGENNITFAAYSIGGNPSYSYKISADGTVAYMYHNHAHGGNTSGNTNTQGHGIPAGGKAGQFLCKQSDEDYDVAWADFEIPKEYGLVTYDQDKTITIT